MPTRILAIMPYPGLCDVGREVAKKRSDVKVDVVLGEMDKGVQAMLSIDVEGYDVLVSRGGTAQMLRQHVSKPVVDIGVSAYDLIRLIRTLGNYRGRIAIVAYDDIASKASLVGELLGRETHVYTISDNYDAEQCVTQLQEEGYDLIIGDVVTVGYAGRIGIDSILMSSGTESVEAAFDAAVTLHLLEQKSKDLTLLYEAALKASNRYIYVCDSEDHVYYNNLPDALLEPILRQLRADDLPKTNGSQEKVVEKDGLLWSVRYQRVGLERGRTATICLLNECGTAGRDAVSIYDAGSQHAASGINVDGIMVSAAVNERLRVLAATMLPVLITGERGIGKDSLAYALHRESALKRAPFVEVDCARLNSACFQRFFGTGGGLWSLKEATLFFSDLEQLDQALQHEVYDFVRQTERTGRYRIVCTASPRIYTLSNEGMFYPKLLAGVNELSIHIPPLRERTEDLPDIVSVVLYELNTLHGCKAVGIEREGHHLLQAYDWPGNIQQFYRVLKELALTAEKSYITRQQVENALAREAAAAPGLQAPALTGGTLEEITNEIIRRVLEEEDQNQSKAAERLGISRSTLWRRIRSM